MNLKSARIIMTAIIAVFLVTLISCASNSSNPLGQNSKVSTKDKTNTGADNDENEVIEFKEFVKSQTEFEKIGITTSDNFYDIISNASYEVYINKENESNQLYKVRFNENLYRIDYYDTDDGDENLIKAIYYTRSEDAYHFVNFLTNTSIKLLNYELNGSDKIQPYSLVTPGYYAITGDDLLVFVKSEIAEGHNCLVYDVYNKDEVLTKRIYISDKYKILIRVEDFLNKVTTVIRNFIPDSVSDSVIVELKKVPENRDEPSEVPVEGHAGASPATEEMN